MVSSGPGRQEIYTLCEMLYEYYKAPLTCQNFVSGFRTYVWRSKRKDVLINVIKSFGIIKCQGYGSLKESVKRFETLYGVFKIQRGLLPSDGNMRQTGGLGTRLCSLLTHNDLSYLKIREDARRNAEQAKNVRHSLVEQQNTARW